MTIPKPNVTLTRRCSQYGGLRLAKMDENPDHIVQSKVTLPELMIILQLGFYIVIC